MHLFIEEKFIHNQKTTVGVDYKAKIVNLGGEEVKLQVTKSYLMNLRNGIDLIGSRFGILLDKSDFGP